MSPAQQEKNAAMAAENMSGYFRSFYDKNPNQVWKRSNKAVIDQWMADHQGQKQFPDNARVALQNVKGLLRSKKKKRGRPRKDAVVSAPAVKAIKAPAKLLERLEDLLDEGLGMLRGVAGDGLHKIAGHLKAARRSVIILGGE
jgi:hypothetical protein